MDKKQLQDNILSQKYDRAVWMDTLKEIFAVKVLYQIPQPINLIANDIASQAVELGKLHTADEREVGIYEVVLKDEAKTKIPVNKVGLRNLLRSIYKYEVDAALIVFVHKDKWRFSYVSEIKTIEGKKETEPKRYTYVFGKGESCRTAADRFFRLIGKPIHLIDLYDAFSVERLNKDFFIAYKEFFEKGVNHLVSNKSYYSQLIDKRHTDEEKKQKPIRDFIKKLLGRIVFLHFLQKKGWLGCSPESIDWGNGDRKFMQTLFSHYPDKDKFHSQCLKALFFKTLNTDRRDNNDLAPQFLWKGQSKGFRIPYLNGGLFDTDISFHEEIDFPKGYFISLLDFFEQYNFTIDENDPYDNEVGIDPEMLGHIFENLLDENREKGTFYTPKEIVHYMCQESLIHYLRTHLPECSEDISPETLSLENFIRTGEIGDRSDRKNFIVKNAETIETLLDNVRVCDPAIGSGAFPMGMLQEIFKAKTALDLTLDHAKVKKKIIQENIYGVDLEPGAVDIARLRFWLSLVVDEDTPKTLPNLDYKIMQGNSLLESFKGIDLSNVANSDMKIIEPERNLFGDIKESQLKVTFTQSENVAEIRRIMKDFYTLENPKDKEEARDRVNKYVHKHIEFNVDLRLLQLERWIGELERDEIVNSKQKKKLEIYKKQKDDLYAMRQTVYDLEKDTSKPFFLWHIFFADVFNQNNSEERGFDIVIGNPPYIQLQKDGGRLANLFEGLGFETFERTGDIYSLFYEKGVDLLNKTGVLCYITSNKWMRANYGASTRQFFMEKTYPLLLVDFGSIQVFETATVDTNILLVQKKPKAWKYESKSFRAVRLNKDFDVRQEGFAKYEKAYGYYMSTVNDNSWVVGESDIYDIKRHIEEQGIPLSKWHIVINYGLKTGLNDAFIIPAEIKDDLIKENPSSTDILKPILRGKDIQKWVADFANLWLIYIPWHFPLHEDTSIVGATEKAEPLFKKKYPAIYNHLSKHRHELESRNQAEIGIRYEWFALQRYGSNYWRDFEKPKIIYPNMTKYLPFVYDEKDHYYSNDKSFIIVGEHLKYLTCFFNSQLFRYCFLDNFPELQGGTRELRKVFFDKIPVKPISDIEEIPFAKMLDYLIKLKKENSKEGNDLLMFNYFEQIVNALVYEFYFGNEFKKYELEIATFIKELPDLNENENILHQLRRVYVIVNKQGNPVRESVYAMLSIPQIALIINTNA